MRQAAEKRVMVNGFDAGAMGDVVEQVSHDPSLAIASFSVRSEWRGGARSESRVEAYELGGERIARRHVLAHDEPRELFGSDSAPNPQELLFAALNACMIFGYAAGATKMGIELDSVRIETTGSLDIRGALGFPGISPGMDAIHYDVHVRAKNASRAQLEELHAAVMATSPNRFHLATPIPLVPRLVLDV